MQLVTDVILLLGQLVKILFETIARWIAPARYKSVEGEVCLITGAGNGMGRLMALHFAERKARLVLWDIDREANERTGELVREIGGSAFVDVCDVSSIEAIKAAAVRAREEVGDVTILVNNAGITYCKELMELSEQQIEKTFSVNTMAHFWINREFLPSMMERNHGHLVTVASTVGLFASAGMPDYTASKHAAVGLHQALYFDLQRAGKTGVKTTLVCPYHVCTGMFQGVKIKYPGLIPSLKPGECVDAIMHAVLTDRPVVAIPRGMYLMYNLATWLPMPAQYALYKFTGADVAMASFLPNRPNQRSEA